MCWENSLKYVWGMESCLPLPIVSFSWPPLFYLHCNVIQDNKHRIKNSFRHSNENNRRSLVVISIWRLKDFIYMKPTVKRLYDLELQAELEISRANGCHARAWSSEFCLPQILQTWDHTGRTHWYQLKIVFDCDWREIFKELMELRKRNLY